MKTVIDNLNHWCIGGVKYWAKLPPLPQSTVDGT